MYLLFAALLGGTVLPFLLLASLPENERWLLYSLLTFTSLLFFGRHFALTGRRLWPCLLFPAVLLVSEWRSAEYQQALQADKRYSLKIVGWVCSAIEPAASGQGLGFEFCLTESSSTAGVLQLDQGQRIQLRCFACSLGDLLAGDHYKLTVTVRARQPDSQAGGIFGWQQVWRFGAWTGSVKRHEPVDKAKGLQETVLKWRIHQQALMAKRWAELEGGQLLSAMVLGQADAMNTEQWDALRQAGLVHLAVVSGLHLSLIGAVAFALGRLLSSLVPAARARPIALIASALGVASYLALVGFAVPVFRASLMVWFGLLLLGLKQRLPFWALLMGAASLTLLVDPLAIVSPGFWMSFTAVAVLALMLPGRRRLWEKAWAVVIAQIMLSLVTLPVLGLHLGLVSWVSPATNLVAVPLVSFWLLPLGLLDMLLGLLQSGAGSVIPGIQWGLNRFWALTDWAAQWPMLPLTGIDVWVCGMLLILLFCGLYLRYRLGLFWLLVVLSGYAISITPAQLDDGFLEVWIHDVGQGLAVSVHQGEQVLVYDTAMAWPGYPSRASQVVLPFLDSRGVSRLEQVIVSHADLDHAGGLQDLLEKYPNTPLVLGEKIVGLDHPHTDCYEGMTWWLGDARVEVLWPPSSGWEEAKGNNKSCTLMLDFAGRRILLPGDLEVKAQRRLLERFNLRLQADVLLIPHHGALSSFMPSFISAVKPRHTVVSAGFANRFGHPNEQVKKWLSRREIPLWNTAVHGSVRVRWGQGQGLEIQAARGQAPQNVTVLPH